MEIKTGQIKKKWEEEGVSSKGKAYVLYFFQVNEKKYSTFNKDMYDAVKVNDFVKLYLEQNGKYTNLKAIESITEKMIEPTLQTEKVDEKASKPSEKPSKFHLSPEEVNARALESSLKFYGERDVQYTYTDVLDLAKEFKKFINGN